MSPAATIPDDPITDELDDALGRARFAKGLADLISNAPKGMTLRIGVYGGWGEGKTSVLKLMQRQLEAKDHVCIFIQSWATRSTDALLERLIRDIARELGISLRLGARQWARPFRKILGISRNVVAAVDPRIKAADAVLGKAIEAVFGEALSRAEAQQTEIVLKMIAEKLGERKLIVFVDDLDRVRPEVIPELLLTLREALNQPNYFYVMALAPDIVQAGLESQNKKWGDATAFLEKIIELPRQLPPASNDELRGFVDRQLEKIGASDHKSRLAELRHVLPPNPRRLKLFLRYIASVQPTLDRFDPDEIEWSTFYVAQMLRIELPLETFRLSSDKEAIDDLEHGFMSAYVKKHETAGDAEYMKHAPKDEQARRRYIELCENVRKRGRWRGRFDLQHLFTLADEPPILTWKEMAAFVDAYGKEGAKNRQERIDAFLHVNGVIDRGKLVALFDTLVEFREGHMSDAVDQPSVEALKERLGIIKVVDEIIVDLAERKLAFREGLLTATHWWTLFTHFEKWSGFAQPEYHDEVRRRERAILSNLLEGISHEFARQVLNGWQESIFATGEKRTFRDFARQLRSEIEIIVAQWALSRFESPGGLDDIYSDEFRSVREILFDPESALYANSDLRSRVIGIAASAVRNRNIQDNFVRFISILKYGAYEGGGGSVSSVGCRKMLQEHDLLRAAWNAATAGSLQPRYAGSLREFRKVAIRDGVPEAVLVVPPWMDRLEKTFFARLAATEEELPED
jgi:hypothetical protein